jgi:hypothetical protein
MESISAVTFHPVESLSVGRAGSFLCVLEQSYPNDKATGHLLEGIVSRSNSKGEKMSQGTVPTMSGSDFTGYTETEKKFIKDLGDWLAGYKGYMGATGYDLALARTLDVSVTATGERALGAVCKKWCIGPGGVFYCCGM